MAEKKSKTDKFKLVKFIYLYLITAITIILVIIGSIGLIRIVLEEYVFDVKDWSAFDTVWDCEKVEIPRNVEPIYEEVAVAELDEDFDKEACIADARERNEARHKNNLKRNLVGWIAMLIVALPLYLYHWRLIRKDN